jgi:hypothetical protein
MLRVDALKIDISPQDIERALVIARSTDAERARFHAQYTQQVNTPFVERAEVVTEFRRVVLLAEERASKGDRFFPYSISSAADALTVWRRRVSIVARVRFHPQNNYVAAPPVTMALDGNERALIGVQREAILALPPGRKGEFVPVLGAIVEGVFEAEALGQAERQFVIALEGRELGRVTFNLGSVE